MICSNCGAENKAGRKFCARCATPLAVICANCGASNEPGDLFCGECATPLVGDASSTSPVPRAIPPAAPAPVAERRLVSVLFADLVGFTTLAEGRDAEDTRELLSKYFDLARDVIVRYGGTVEKFIGDAVMAVWGAPTAHEDDAERAVRAALELVDAVRGLGPGVTARAGVLTGEAAVTLGATNEGIVAGDMVNTASRIQSAAAPGTVLVGEATYRAASRAIAFEPIGEQMLKGKAAPVAAWRALRVVAQRGGRNRADTLEAPFVGRDDELRLIKDLFQATGRERRIRLVSVTGAAGIGKTRLASEFLKYLDGLVEPDVFWHDGRSPAYGEGITFWALGEMVRGRAGLLETDDEATTRSKIAEVLSRFVADEEERRWIESALLALLGIETVANADQLFSAWRTFFERIAERAPVVMVFEDFHFADAGLLDFVDHLQDWSKGFPLYVVTLSRPELQERRPDWGAGKRSFTSLHLEPLGEPAMRELIAGLVPGLPETAVGSIIARADGVPLYAIETVRMLVADGRLVITEGSYHPVGDLTALAVPETLQELIAARLDGLEPAERSLIQDAAVLGQSFTLEGITAVNGAEPSVIESRLRLLVRRELLTFNADPRSPERGQYVFVQALIREVAYGTLAKRDRKSRHLAAARFFESLGEEEIAGALAGHYLAGYRNASEGPEADALAAQARIALSAAADRAAALGASEQALSLLRASLEITLEAAERPALEERAAAAAIAIAQPKVAQEYLESALEWYRRDADKVAIARAATNLGTALINEGQLTLAAERLEQAVAETAGSQEGPEVVRLLAELSRAYALLRDPRALQTVDRVLAAAESLELMPVIVEGLINRALVLDGHPQEAAVVLRGVIPLAEANGLVTSQVRAINNLASTVVTDDIRASYDLVKRGLELVRRQGSRDWLLHFLGFYYGCASWIGEFDEATKALAELEGIDLPPNYALGLGENQAQRLALLGRIDEADAALARVAPIRATLGDPRLIGGQRWTEAWVHLAAGRLEAAYEAGLDGGRLNLDMSVWDSELATRAALWMGDATRARTALSLLESRPERGRWIGAIRTELRAGVAALEEDPAGALVGYRAATRSLRELDLPFALARCLLDFGLLLGSDVDEARAAADEARAIFTRLGCPTFLARLDTATSSWPAAREPWGRGVVVEGPISAEGESSVQIS